MLWVIELLQRVRNCDRIEITRTMAVYEEAVQHMKAARIAILRPVSKQPSYTRATQHLFSAYAQENAERKREPAQQADNYVMAEEGVAGCR